MVSRAILQQHALVSFSMTPNCTCPADSGNIGVIEKLTSACMLFQNFTRNHSITYTNIIFLCILDSDWLRTVPINH